MRKKKNKMKWIKEQKAQAKNTGAALRANRGVVVRSLSLGSVPTTFPNHKVRELNLTLSQKYSDFWVTLV